MPGPTLKSLMDVTTAYAGSNAAVTIALYERLERLGPDGVIAMNLLRAQKASSRAKVYRGGNTDGSYRGQAYRRKQWAMDRLCDTLGRGDSSVTSWGWKEDDEVQGPHRWVLYIDLPTCGQVSFHTHRRSSGPDYPGEWDRQRDVSPARVQHFAAKLLDAAATERITS